MKRKGKWRKRKKRDSQWEPRTREAEKGQDTTIERLSRRQPSSHRIITMIIRRTFSKMNIAHLKALPPSWEICLTPLWPNGSAAILENAGWRNEQKRLLHSLKGVQCVIPIWRYIANAQVYFYVTVFYILLFYLSIWKTKSGIFCRRPQGVA